MVEMELESRKSKSKWEVCVESVRPEEGKFKSSKPMPTVSYTSMIKGTERERALQKRTGGHSTQGEATPVKF